MYSGNSSVFVKLHISSKTFLVLQRNHKHFSQLTFCCIDYHIIDFPTAPTAPPLSVSHTDVTATHVSLSWAPPPTDQQNGIIRQYIVAVVGQGGRNFTVETTQPEVTVGGLHPFYMYSFSIAAITIAPGPYSDEYIVETLEDGKTIHVKPQTVSSYNSFLHL